MVVSEAGQCSAKCCVKKGGRKHHLQDLHDLIVKGFMFLLIVVKQQKAEKEPGQGQIDLV